MKIRGNLCVNMCFPDEITDLERRNPENSLVVHWLGLYQLTVENLSSIPGLVIKISQAIWQSQKKKKSGVYISINGPLRILSESVKK